MNAKNRTKLTPVMLYLDDETVARLDEVRGDKSRSEEARERLARSLRMKKPRIQMGRPKKESRNDE